MALPQHGSEGLVPRPERRREIHWLGPPARMESGKIHFRGAEVDGTPISLGDHVFLQPAEANIPLYIGHIEDLAQMTVEAGGVSGHAMTVTVSWFYRPQELEIDSDLPVYENEIFAADETATHPLESVAGKCLVLMPGKPTVKQSHQQASTLPVFVCSKKYIPSEGRVVPLEGVEESIAQKPRTFVLVNGLMYPRSTRPSGSLGNGRHAQLSFPSAGVSAPQPAGLRAASKRKRGHGSHANMEHIHIPSVSGGMRSSPGRSAGPGSGSTSMGGAPNTSAERSGGGTVGLGGNSTPRSRARGLHGRWSDERYDAARGSLIHILRMMGATGADKAVLRPALREQARKVIGDTGLLDHLLKHLADQVVAPNGERLRRRHNREGHMEYWLQNPAVAEAEEEMLKEEMQALTSELREVREARHVLQAVRSEAAQAIQVVSGLKQHPEEAVAIMGMVASPTAAAAAVPSDVQNRLDVLEAALVELKVRVHDAENLAAAGMEEIRKEEASAGTILGQHIANFTKISASLENRCLELERNGALALEDAAGRYEALASALSQAVAATTVLGQELVRRDNVMMALQQEVSALRQAFMMLQSQGYQSLQEKVLKQQLAPRGDIQSGMPEAPTSPPVVLGPVQPGHSQALPRTETACLNAALTLPMPGQVLEPATLQDMALAGVETAHGINPMTHDHEHLPSVTNKEAASSPETNI